MRLIVEESPGKYILNYMWLPTWIGMNLQVKKSVEQEIRENFVGRELNEELVDEMEEAVIKHLVSLFPELEFEGYLRALKDVHQKAE